VESNPADIYLIQKIIADHDSNIRVWVVPNGRDALTFLRKEGGYKHVPTPTFILLDLRLPYLPGTDVLTMLRHLPPYAQTPVVVFSSTEGEQEKLRCLQLGANAYELKPGDFDTYCVALHNILQQWLLPSGSKESSQ
jgi:two-component system, chemotaxis family, response regulator Rcp1